MNPFRMWWTGCMMIGNFFFWLGRATWRLLSLPETTDVLVVVTFLMFLAMVSFVLS